jgi:hemerythrin
MEKGTTMEIIRPTTHTARTLAAAVHRSRRELALELERLARMADDVLAAHFPAFVDRLERDFRDEELLIEALNHRAVHSHREQHARALAALHQAETLLQNGDVKCARKAVLLLDQWLMLHHWAVDLALVASLATAARRATSGGGRQRARRAPGWGKKRIVAAA